MDQTDARRLSALFESAANTTCDSNPKLWDEVLIALKLDLRYQPAIAEVLRRSTWRNAKNIRAYVASAAVRSARGQRLPDYSEKEFRRVASSNHNDDVGTHIDSGAGFDIEDWGGGGVYERSASGALRYVDFDDDDYYRQFPEWLQRGGELDAVDWETIAAYAVLKPRMACLLARVLIMRLEQRLGRPEAMARGANAKEASAIEAAWKWIDRNADDRIAPLFKMTTPPRILTAESIASFPMLASDISLRLDIKTWWDRKENLLILRRDDTLNLRGVEAHSEKAARQILGRIAADCDEPEIFHYWTVQEPVGTGAVAIAKPWEVLSRVSNRSYRNS